MIDLVFWSFAVAIAPIVLALGSKCVALIAAPLGPPDAHPYLVHTETRHAPHRMPTRISRTGGFGHGR